ncbi:hypothetical protein AB7282_12060 [Providencia huaxiensis]|uniref:hypothetical protein n=1 Tax=Providencia huaxiensis TaxID=2027290 RepID=UPI0032D9EF57
MNTLVMILTSESGEEEEPFWHAMTYQSPDDQVLCSGQFFGEGVSACTFKTKVVKKGGITCPACLSAIKHYKTLI